MNPLAGLSQEAIACAQGFDQWRVRELGGRVSGFGWGQKKTCVLFQVEIVAVLFVFFDDGFFTKVRFFVRLETILSTICQRVHDLPIKFIE